MVEGGGPIITCFLSGHLDQWIMTICPLLVGEVKR
jgi:riboflavin biosynthesis pyrimidine reductase